MKQRISLQTLMTSKEYYEFYTYKFDNLIEMDKFLGNHKLPQ